MDRDLNMHNQIGEVQRSTVLRLGEVVGRSRFKEGEPLWVVRTMNSPNGTLYFACLNDTEAVWKVTEEHASEFIEISGNEMFDYMKTLTHSSIENAANSAHGEWSRDHEDVYHELIKSKIAELASDTNGIMFNQQTERWRNKSIMINNQITPLQDAFDSFDTLSTPDQLELLVRVTRLTTKYN